MTQRLFCYHCRAYHPIEDMARYPTKSGLRWRCVHSIRAADQDVGCRDAFGKAQTSANRDLARRQAERSHMLWVARQRQW